MESPISKEDINHITEMFSPVIEKYPESATIFAALMLMNNILVDIRLELAEIRKK